MSHIRTVIGIDPGVTTGIALYDTEIRQFTLLTSGKILEMMELVRKQILPYVFIEDARLRTWFGNSGREVLQGAGSIKRDCQIWEDFLTYHTFPSEFIKPRKGTTKWNAKLFKAATGYMKRTNAHSRDAAILLYDNLQTVIRRNK